MVFLNNGIVLRDSFIWGLDICGFESHTFIVVICLVLSFIVTFLSLFCVRVMAKTMMPEMFPSHDILVVNWLLLQIHITEFVLPMAWIYLSLIHETQRIIFIIKICDQIYQKYIDIGATEILFI